MVQMSQCLCLADMPGSRLGRARPPIPQKQSPELTHQVHELLTQQSMKVTGAQELPEQTAGRPYLAGVSHADEGVIQDL